MPIASNLFSLVAMRLDSFPGIGEAKTSRKFADTSKYGEIYGFRKPSPMLEIPPAGGNVTK